MEPFTLPPQGGGVVHSDRNLSDYIRLPVPSSATLKWYKSELAGEQTGSFGNGITGNGTIAAATFMNRQSQDNLVIYDYDGNRLWSSGKLLTRRAFYSAPLVDIYGRVITCDDRIILMVDSNTKDIVWQSELPHGGTPYSPVITTDGTIILATDKGPVYAYDSMDGSLLATKYLGDDDNIRFIYRVIGNDPGWFSTVNTPCVNGNRIYLSTKYKGVRGLSTIHEPSRFYALDVDRTDPDILTEAWHWDFYGSSTASPTFINDTLYFDTVPGRWRKFIAAITDKGDHPELKWKVPYDYIAYASFTYDPRGGLWYVDPFNQRIVRFSTEDGHIIEIIDIYELMLNEEPSTAHTVRGKTPRFHQLTRTTLKYAHVPWLPFPIVYSYGHYTSSVATMCGTDTNPVLLVSASSVRPFYHATSYVLAFDLANNNALLWKFKVWEGVTFGMFGGINFPFGQYTILVRDSEPRVVFGTIFDGVFSIG